MAKDSIKTSKQITQAGGDVRFAQAYLKRYGYLAQLRYKAGVIDESTKLGITQFQRFFGLKVTGKLEDSTLRAMAIVRCGLPDPAARARYVAQCPWTAALPIHFTFGGGSTSISDDDALAAVMRAISTWNPVDVPNVPTFQKVDANPDLVIAWFKEDPDLGFASTTYAHADFPPACPVINKNPPPTPLHFNDKDMSWTNNPVPGLADVESVALHELGHVLGLGHSAVAGAVMFPALELGSLLRTLSADDHEGLLSLYP
jgi:hypothetical protein